MDILFITSMHILCVHIHLSHFEKFPCFLCEAGFRLFVESRQGELMILALDVTNFHILMTSLMTWAGVVQFLKCLSHRHVGDLFIFYDTCNVYFII